MASDDPRPAPDAAEPLAAAPAAPHKGARAAQVVNHLLGGHDAQAADRHAAEQLTKLVPLLPATIVAGRDFVHHAITHLVRMGITQIVDLGCGLPLQGAAVHDVAQREDPQARVVYVDKDPVVLAHARALLATNDTILVVAGDAREPGTILGNPDLQQHLDWTQPAVVVAAGLLHHLGDAEADVLLTALRATLPPGSAVVLTHPYLSCIAEDLAEEVRSLHEAVIGPLRLRSKVDIEALLLGLLLQEPGLIPLQRWRTLWPPAGRPKHDDAELPALAGIAWTPGRTARISNGRPT